MQPQVGVILFTHFILPDVEESAGSQRFASLLLEIPYKHYRAKSGMPPLTGPRGAVSSFSFFTEFFGSRYGLHRKVGTTRSLLGTGKMRLLFDLVFLLVGLSRISSSILPPFSFLNMTI